jgi:hypothetical protein
MCEQPVPNMRSLMVVLGIIIILVLVELLVQELTTVGR